MQPIPIYIRAKPIPHCSRAGPPPPLRTPVFPELGHPDNANCLGTGHYLHHSFGRAWEPRKIYSHTHTHTQISSTLRPGKHFCVSPAHFFFSLFFPSNHPSLTTPVFCPPCIQDTLFRGRSLGRCLRLSVDVRLRSGRRALQSCTGILLQAFAFRALSPGSLSSVAFTNLQCSHRERKTPPHARSVDSEESLPKTLPNRAGVQISPHQTFGPPSLPFTTAGCLLFAWVCQPNSLAASRSIQIERHSGPSLGHRCLQNSVSAGRLCWPLRTSPDLGQAHQGQQANTACLPLIN